MKLNNIIVPVALSAIVLAPIAANADSLQSQKNTMRNLAIGAGALGVYGLLHHNSTLGLIGVAGAALAGNQYEKDRHQQSVNNSYRNYYYRNYDRSYYYNNGNSNGYGHGNGHAYGHYKHHRHCDR